MASRAPNPSPQASGSHPPAQRQRGLGHRIAIGLWVLVVLWLTVPIAVSLVSNIFFPDAPPPPTDERAPAEQVSPAPPNDTPARLSIP